MSDRVRVTVFEDGPIQISGAGSVSFCGEALEVDGDVYVCRCGDSNNAPFCDGTHSKVGFDGGCEEPPAAALKTWEGKTLRTVFNPNACMHVFYCKPLKELRERELAGDAEAAAEIMRVVGTCPSGALTYETKTELVEPAPVPGPAVDIMEGGEVRIQADFDINVPLLERLDGNRATLCRCGRSKNKPWCDGRHKGRKGFR